jgi:uncharacterized protein YeaO (DUF488 family)
VLVDRLWPRGVSKATAALDDWAKDVAPSTELRKWFGHDPARWQEFQRRYRQELLAHPEILRPLLDAAAKGPLTLVYAAKDEQHNEAVVLQQVIAEQLARTSRTSENQEEESPARA